LIRNDRTLVLEYWLPLLLWISAVYLFSTDSFSGSETSRYIVPLLRFLFPWLSAQGIDLLHGVIRKLGHVSEYFVLTLLAYRSFRYEQSGIVQARLRAVGFIVLAAIVDEGHQLMTISRSGSLMDVGYDTLGGVCALWLITIYETRHLRPYSVL
jgi:VanZ family protein